MAKASDKNKTAAAPARPAFKPIIPKARPGGPAKIKVQEGGTAAPPSTNQPAQ